MTSRCSFYYYPCWINNCVLLKLDELSPKTFFTDVWECGETFGCEKECLIWFFVASKRCSKITWEHEVHWILWEHRGKEINLKTPEISSKWLGNATNKKQPLIASIYWSWWSQVHVVFYNQCKWNTSFYALGSCTKSKTN